MGVLALPPPPLADLSSQVSEAYAFLADLDNDESQVAKALAQDRPTVLRLLGELPGGRLRGIALR